MKILIVNSYVRENGGDAAILKVHLQQLRVAYPKAKITIASIEDPKQRPSFDGAKNIGSIRRYVGQEDVSVGSRVSRKLLSFALALFGFVGPLRRVTVSRLLPAEMRAELRAIYEADLVVCVGGGHLNAVKGLGGDLNVFYLTLPIILAERLGKPVVYGPQSYGPFWGFAQKYLVLKALNNANFVMAREAISYNLLLDLGVKKDHVLLTVDSGFAFTSDQKVDVREMYKLPKKSKVVAITMRAWFSGARREALEKSFAKFIDFLHGKGYEVLLVPQVTTHYRADDDRIAEARIADYCQGKKPVLVADAAEAGQLKSLYDDVDFVVGTRFHSVIFALTSYIPCMAVEYDHKTSGIMQSLGLGEWVISLNDVTAKDLRAMFTKLEKNAESYVGHVRQVVPPNVVEATDMVAKIQAALGR